MGGDTNARSPLYDKTSFLQRVAGYGCITFAAMAVLCIAEMMKGKNLEKGFLGGLDFKELIFNYHPIFMTTGLILLSFTAVLSYRILPLPKAITKPLHAFLQFSALCFVVMGLTCVLVGNNYPDYNSLHMYFANFTTVHSFIGLAAIGIFAQNYFLGFYHYLLPEAAVSLDQRKKYMPMHVFLGMLAVFLSVLAMETGLMELMTDLSFEGYCTYEVTSADTNPASNYHLLNAGCKWGNAAGIFVLAAVACFFFAMFDFSRFGKGNNQDGADESLLKQQHANHVSYHA